MDIVEILQRQIRILRKVDQLKADDDILEFEEAIETILEHIDQIDTANGKWFFILYKFASNN